MDVPLSISGIYGADLIKTLAQIGRKSGVCFGLDIKNPKLLKQEINLSSPTTLRNLVGSLGPSFAFSVENNVFVFTVGVPEKPDWLDTRIPDFKSISAPAEYISSKVYSFLEAKAHPESFGSIGSTSVSNTRGTVHAFELRNASVRSLLTAILANSTQRGMWFTVTSHSSDKPLPERPFWNLYFYTQAEELDKYDFRP